MIMSWDSFKNFANSKTPALSMQIISEDAYSIYLYAVADGMFNSECIIKKYDVDTLSDFDDNYRASANKSVIKKDASGNTITVLSPFATDDNYEADYVGFSGVASASSITNVDFKLPKDLYFHGLQMILYNHNEDDLVQFQIVDRDYIMKGILYPIDYNGTSWSIVQPNGVVLKQFGTNWNVDSQFNQQDDLTEDFLAKLIKDLYVRIVYNSTGSVAVKVKCNMYTLKRKI